MRVQIGYKSMPLAPFHNGALELYARRIILRPPNAVETLTLPAGTYSELFIRVASYNYVSGSTTYSLRVDQP